MKSLQRIFSVSLLSIMVLAVCWQRHCDGG